MRRLSNRKEPASPFCNGKAGSAFVCLAHLLNTIFSCTTSIRISFLHFGQYSGNFTRTVSSYTLVRVFPPQTGQWIHREFFRLSFTCYTSVNGIAPRSTSGFCPLTSIVNKADGLWFLTVHQLCVYASGLLITEIFGCAISKHQWVQE